MKGKTQKGITLIALIITIVILLILAVVTIGVVQESGIIGHAQDASSKYTIAQEKEQIGLAVSEYQIQKTLGTTQSFEEVITNALQGQNVSIDGETNGLTVTFNKTGNAYAVAENGTIEGPLGSSGGDSTGGESGGSVVTPPGGDVVPETYATTITGLAEGVSLVEYVNLTEGLKASADSGKITAVLTETKDSETYTAVIPAGFTVSTTDEEDSISGGLVIRDESLNEFVWVPVKEDINTSGYEVGGTPRRREPDIITGSDGTSYDAVLENLQIAECTENPDDDDTVLTSDDFKVELTKMYESMAESVNRYDGFYVGRYATSNNAGIPQSKGSTADNLIETASTVSTNWYGLYALNKKYSTSSVRGSMIWGIQYNKMMDWMGSAANIKNADDNKTMYTGSVVTDVIKNVYDLYGNGKELTLEANDEDMRAYRAFSLTQGRVPNTYGATKPTVSNDTWSLSTANASRLAIYIL